MIESMEKQLSSQSLAWYVWFGHCFIQTNGRVVVCLTLKTDKIKQPSLPKEVVIPQNTKKSKNYYGKPLVEVAGDSLHLKDIKGMSRLHFAWKFVHEEAVCSQWIKGTFWISM